MVSITEAPKETGKENTFIANMNLYAWVEERHLLSVASPQDIPLLLGVRAAVYARLSDECLDEVARLDRVIIRLGRSRYRKVVGLTAEAKGN